MLAGSKDIFSICNLLGIKDASRKRTESPLNTVPWEGTVSQTSNKEVEITATHIKWKKKKSCHRTGDIDEGGQCNPQEIGAHKSFPNLCGKDFQVDEAIPQGPAYDH